MWGFCLRSLLREYGWRFLRRVAVRRPCRTLRAFRDAGRIDVDAAVVDVGNGGGAGARGGPASVVGAGFCLKPLEPPCPSGRANHDCRFLEQLDASCGDIVSAPCRDCAIRDLGLRALRAGSAFYVMTSARDILDDVYVPALDGRLFRRGVFVLCRYSFKPFAAGLLASGMSARLLPLGSGDCRDYPTWLLADRGIKAERSTVADPGLAGVPCALGDGPPQRATRFERRGNVLHPARAGPAA
jgi:hypothetical protein